MTSRMPPVPPQNRSPKGTGEADHMQDRGKTPDEPRKTNKTGQLGNIKQNTTNQGHQQDQ